MFSLFDILNIRTMAECNSVSSVSQEVIEEEPIAEEFTENAAGEESHVEEVNADNMATNKKELSEGKCKTRSFIQFYN